jgi:hypothetical protein
MDERKMNFSLPPNSVIVVDIASYNNVVILPTSNLKKKMLEWLAERCIPFQYEMLKPALYDLIILCKPGIKKYC